MKKKNKEIDECEPDHLSPFQSTGSYRPVRPQREGSTRDSLSARVSDERALRRLSLFLYANDGAVDDMLRFLDAWERQTGRSLIPREESAPPQDPNDALSHKANRMLREREHQYKVMPEALRSEAYVRILLALFVDSVQKIKTSSKSACLASGCPNTTALRYLDNLAEAGLVVRISSASDKRVTEIALTKEGLELTRKLLDEDRP